MTEDETGDLGIWLMCYDLTADDRFTWFVYTMTRISERRRLVLFDV